jgi:nicotinamidase-related amidase
MNTALILIDVQQSFVHRPYYQSARAAEFLARTNALIDGCTRRSIPVIRVLHVDAPEQADNPFAMISGQVRPMDGLTEFTPAAEFHKTRHSALVGSGLGVWLRQNAIGRLIIAGIRTEQCCETTTRHASDEGFEVDYVAEATLTFDMTHLDGSPLLAKDIIARTTAVLKDRFATICTVEQALDRASAANREQGIEREAA